MVSPRIGWLFSPALDLAAFLLPTLTALLLCGALWLTGDLGRPLSPLGWLLLVVMIDVAHVYATIYRVYANPAELRRRPLLYALVPVLCLIAGLVLCQISWLAFWRVLAYVAVIHFVRQQAGWVALSRRADRGPGGVGARWARVDRLLDGAAVYAGTLYPLLYWHVHLPRRFHWFVDGDFARLVPPALLPPATLLWAVIGALWLLRQGHRLVTERSCNAAKLLIMGSTWATWYIGIVALDSDVAFTLTNVMHHGIPYLLVVFRYHEGRRGAALSARVGGVLAFAVFYAPLLGLALLEEGVWDRLVWHDHGMFFPLPASVPELSTRALALLAPWLALPQVTHYMLDAWIWRSGQNPGLARYLGLSDR